MSLGYTEATDAGGVFAIGIDGASDILFSREDNLGQVEQTHKHLHRLRGGCSSGVSRISVDSCSRSIRGEAGTGCWPRRNT